MKKNAKDAFEQVASSRLDDLALSQTKGFDDLVLSQAKGFSSAEEKREAMERRLLEALEEIGKGVNEDMKDSAQLFADLNVKNKPSR